MRIARLQTLCVLLCVALIARVAAQTPVASDEPASTQDSDALAKRTPAAHLEKVVVVDSRRPAAEGQTAQDIHIYDLERIEQSGQFTLGDFLATRGSA